MSPWSRAPGGRTHDQDRILRCPGRGQAAGAVLDRAARARARGRRHRHPLLRHLPYRLIIDTISAPHDHDEFLRTLRPRGAMVLVGIPPEPTPLSAFALVGGNKRLAGSMIGGMAETQEMLDDCADNRIVADVEVIPVQKVNQAYERMLRADVRYRFVIDMASLR
ncbi:MAG TPA: zinc-binding dehydrogenase [Kofleriaceae bacterium]|nr:zinc-binding dehydrogenase [Kofleriaceae bacterium]